MPTMGKPLSAQEKRYQQIQMAKNTNARNQDEAERKVRGDLLNDLTGFVPDNKVKNIKNPNQMGKDEFLKLLTHQLQNQDPLNPMDQTKMTAELAQFSQLEQLANLNTKFDGLSRNDKMEAKFYGAGFVGKEVVTAGNSVKLGDEGKADVIFTLPQEAARVLVRIHDGKGNQVGEVWKENIGRGNQTFTWDGKGMDGTRQPAGDYRTSVFAWDAGNAAIKTETKVTGVVESVYFENGETVLQVDGKKVFLRDVDSFHTPGASKKIGMNTQNQQVRRGAQNFPTAQNSQQNLRLKGNVNKPAAIDSYRQQTGEPTTGITSVYDE
jgi:flagellar basal-body rod modification protein FlgD